MRVMALDIGKVRTGIAISDISMRVASPVAVLATHELMSHSIVFRRMLEEWEPETLVCGVPKTLAGEDGPQAKQIRMTAKKIARMCNLSLEFADERLSSAEAKRSLREKGLSEKEMRGKVDMIAACLFLQAWLDARHAIEEKRE